MDVSNVDCYAESQCLYVGIAYHGYPICMRPEMEMHCIPSPCCKHVRNPN